MSSHLLTGRSIARVEDERLLRGRGRYVDDVRVPGTLHACFLRSPHAHARIRQVDVAAARAVPGVVRVLTGRDMAGLVGRLSSFYEVPALRKIEFDALARDKVRFSGDMVAMVIAESRYAAEDGCDEIDVEYDALPAVTSAGQGRRSDAPLVFEDLGTNVVFEDSACFGDVEAAFGRAAHVISETFRQHRQSPCPMETRGGIATFDPYTEELTYHASTQSAHSLRRAIALFLGHPLQLTRVTAGDNGGSFGEKFTMTREDLCVCAASRLLGRPVKWIEDRRENLMTGGHAREEVMEAELALAADGAILGLRARLTIDGGAYPAIRLYMPAELYSSVREDMPSAYRIPAFELSCRSVATNKATYVAYRGPWEVETWVRERLLDEAAREIGLDPAELRRRNLITPAEQPYKTVTGAVLDEVTAGETLEAVLAALDYPALRDRQRAALDEGRYLGIGIAGHCEHNGREGVTERTTVRVELDGTVTVHTAQLQTGQGHQTTLAQLVADELSVPHGQVRLVYGDTSRVPFKVIGTGGSMASTMATGSVLAAVRKVRDQVRRIAAHLLECDPGDIQIIAAQAMVRGDPSSALPLAEIAETAYLRPLRLPPGQDPCLEATETYYWPGHQWTVATHGCVVELDPRTGKVEIERYVAAVDCGTVINPAIVEGQIRGGIAQGIAGVLYEHSQYDDEGQYLASTFMDYLVPTAAEIPDIEIHLLPGPEGEVRPKGVGETGAIAAPATVTNAIADALSPLGVRVTQQYLPPSVIAGLIGRATAPGDPATLARG
ncbi:MAG: xanthine dehydrogenase family protein molybdopterin-binding subunit [Trebonia sp.]